MPTAAFVVNRNRIRHFPQLRHRCAAAAAARGWEMTLLETRSADAGDGATREAIAAGARLVFAVGGDGTVRACAQALAGGQVPLAIVPRGTANLVATALGIPSSLGAALAVGFGRHERRIDQAVADGVTFAAMAGIGLDAAVVGATADGLKGAAGWLGYAAAGISRLAGPSTRFEIRLDGGEPMARQARCVVVGNVGLLPGGFALIPGARPDDGLLDVSILAPAGPFGWPRVGWRVLTRSRHDDHVLERHQARRVEIVAEVRLPRQADGELIGAACSLAVTLAPVSLLVRVPEDRRRRGSRSSALLSGSCNASCRMCKSQPHRPCCHCFGHGSKRRCSHWSCSILAGSGR
jgi:diacylglycerol kinase family enzyme